MPSEARRRLLDHVASRVPRPSAPDCVLVAVDGVDAAGKSTFADELVAALRARRRATVRISVDDFHNPRAVRYRRGRESPEGFWSDAFDYARLRADVLRPLGPGGSRRYRPVAHDLRTDAELRPEPLVASPGSVVVVDGLFLHRDELVDAWDFSIFLDVPVETSVRRMAARDGSNPDASHPEVRRYVEAQRLYFAACAPSRRADVVIDNSDPDAPRLGQPCGPPSG